MSFNQFFQLLAVTIKLSTQSSVHSPQKLTIILILMLVNINCFYSSSCSSVVLILFKT